MISVNDIIFLTDEVTASWEVANCVTHISIPSVLVIWLSEYGHQHQQQQQCE